VRLASQATAEQLAATFPDLLVRPLRDTVYPGRTQAVPVLLAAAGALLLVAWVQVTALVFSGSLAQLRETGVRLALGAGRLRLVRQFAADAALTAGLAFTLAWLIVGPLTAFIVLLLPPELTRGQYLNPDMRTFGFGCALLLLGFVLQSVVPVGVAGWITPSALLTGRLADKPIRVERARYGLLVGQMTLTAFLLYLAGLAVHSFVQAAQFDYGFDADRVLVFRPPPWYRSHPAVEQSFADLAERNRKVNATLEMLSIVPGVVGAATFEYAPLGVGPRDPGLAQNLVTIERFDGVPRPDVQARVNVVGVDFLNALGATLVSGRSFDDPTFATRRDVVVVNETLGRRLSPPLYVAGEPMSPPVVGHEIVVPGHRGPALIIGVIKDLVDTTPEVPADPQLFRPSRSGAGFGIVMRVSSSVDAELPAIRFVLERVWGPLPPRQISLMRDELRTVLKPLRAQSILLSLIAACCLPIAMVGLIGTLIESVRSRMRDIAIRLVLGAEPRTIRRAVVRRALAGVSIGILLGTGAGTLVGWVIAHQLFQVEPSDPWTMGAVFVALISMSWLAVLAPARSVLRVEPANALRDV
jgi:putative ABC transport system permease protein